MKKTMLLAFLISFASLAAMHVESEKINLVVVNFDVPEDTVPIYPPV